MFFYWFLYSFQCHYWLKLIIYFPSDIIDQTETATIPMNTNGWQRQRYPHLLYASDLESDKHSARKNYKGSRSSFQVQNGEIQTNVLYASDLETENRATRYKNKTMRFSFQNMNRQRYPDAQYASDIKPDNRSIRYKNNDRLTSFQKIREPLRFVPSPLSTLYQRNVTGVQSRTISEAVVLPGFSHLSPNYNNSGLNDLFGHQYNDLTRLGLFPEQWNLID